MPDKSAKPKAKTLSRASATRKSTAKPKKSTTAGNARSLSKASTRAKPSAGRVKPAQPPTLSDDKSKSEQASGAVASRLIDERIAELEGWRGEALARMRRLIRAADPEMTEEWKWRGTPVWSHHGIVCTGESYTKVIKLTFARGAALPDPQRLFNSSLEGNTRRAIDIHEGEKVNAAAFKALIKAAVALNATRAKKANPNSKQAPKPQAGTNQKVALLSGGNPQIAKADGDAPVQAYIAAMPGWKRDLGKRLDKLIEHNVPSVRKAVKWNSPFYGMEGQGWFLSFHVFTRYVKVTFFKGAALQPVPPGGTDRSKEARWIDIHENDELDLERLAAWIQQAAALPGWAT